MAREARIEPVGTRHRADALRFIAAGDQRGGLADAQGKVLSEMADGRESPTLIWWARRRRTCVAAALVMRASGRIGMLFSCRADAPGVDAAVLPRVIRAVADDALERGDVLVQSLTAPGAEADIAVLESAGLQPLAELIYMQRTLKAPPEIAPRDELTWRASGEFTDGELVRLIEQTYEASLDCPGLRGLRDMSDVIAGHQGSAGLTPDAWWIVDVDGAAAGCILVNNGQAATADVAYLGVIAAQRGRGIGLAMLRHAIEQARAAGKRMMNVAVDSRNVHAKRLYEAEGFVETRRRLAHILTRAAE